jgi:hypothetical protein
MKNISVWIQASLCINGVTILITDNNSWLLAKYIEGFDHQIDVQ